MLISIVLAIVYRVVIQEIRLRVEKPVMDELGNKVQQNITPDTEKIDWATAAPKVLQYSTLHSLGPPS